MTTGGYRPSWARFRTVQCIKSSSFRSLLVRHYRKDDWTNTLSHCPATIALRTRAAKKWAEKCLWAHAMRILFLRKLSTRVAA